MLSNHYSLHVDPILLDKLGDSVIYTPNHNCLSVSDFEYKHQYFQWYQDEPRSEEMAMRW